MEEWNNGMNDGTMELWNDAVMGNRGSDTALGNNIKISSTCGFERMVKYNLLFGVLTEHGHG